MLQGSFIKFYMVQDFSAIYECFFLFLIIFSLYTLWPKNSLKKETFEIHTYLFHLFSQYCENMEITVNQLDQIQWQGQECPGSLGLYHFSQFGNKCLNVHRVGQEYNMNNRVKIVCFQITSCCLFPKL